MSVTVKSRSVMNRLPDEELDEEIVSFTNAELDADGMIADEDQPDMKFVALGIDLWTHMGKPEVLTMTLEIGDKLND